MKISSSARRTPVIVLGGLGAAGQMHSAVHHRLGTSTILVDTADRPLSHWERRLPWSEAIVDVCTPTALHGETLTWAHNCGARRFIVEKPAARSAGEWTGLLARLDESHVLAVHNYLFSEAFRRALAEQAAVTHIASSFDKPRAVDDARHRGADRFGILPHTVQVEMPHQVAMSLTIAPGLRVRHLGVDSRGTRGNDPAAAVSCTVRLSDGLRTARLSTDLRAPRSRWLTLEGPDQSRVHCQFPEAGTGESRVTLHRPGRSSETVFQGHDDMLGACLASALQALDDGVTPPGLAPGLAHAVLRCIDDALAHDPSPGWPSAEARTGVGPG